VGAFLRNPRLMLLYRIADTRHPVWDGTGAFIMGGRFNSPGRMVIYAAQTYSCALLEVLAHANIGRLPANQTYVEASAPEGIAYEKWTADRLPAGWDSSDTKVARAFGDTWLDERRSAILLVPSVIARLDFNALVNPFHPDFQKITVSKPQPVIWDQRLFRNR
jgi:RES domain-containing protein